MTKKRSDLNDSISIINKNNLNQIIIQIRAIINEYKDFMKTVTYSNDCLIPEDSKKLHHYHDLMEQSLMEVLENNVPGFTLPEIWEYIDFFDEIKVEFENKTYISCLDEIIRRDKNNEKALFLKAVNIGDKGKYSQAVTLLKRIIKNNPDNHKALFLKAQYMEYQAEKQKNREKFIEALKDINRALELERKIQMYWLQKKSILKEFQEAEQPDSTVEGKNDFLLNCYKEFYNTFDEMVEDIALCYQKIIELYLSDTSEKDDYSIEANNRLEAVDVSLYCYLLIDLKEYEKAIEYLKLEEELEDYDPEGTIHHNNLLRAECFEKIGRYEEALKYRILYNEKLKEEDDFLYEKYDGDQGRLLRKSGKEKKAMDILIPLCILKQTNNENTNITFANHYSILEDLGLYDAAIKAYKKHFKSLPEKYRTKKSDIREYENDLAGLTENKKNDLIPKSWKKLLEKNFDLDNFRVRESVIMKYKNKMQ